MIKCLHVPMYLTIVDRNLSNFFVMTHKTEKFQIEKEVDLYSRKRQYHAGKEICNNFNSERRCQLSRYKTAHLCSDCNGELSSKQKKQS